MAKCGFKIIPPSTSGGNYTIGVNQDQSSFSSTTYTLNINGSASLNAPIYLQKPSSQHTQIQFHDDDTSGIYTGRLGSIYQESTSTNYIFFEQRNYSAAGQALSYTESYRLPQAAVGTNSDSIYHILTDKDTVTIAQGGTGATTSAAARIALGLGTAATHAHGDYKAAQTAVSTSGTSGISYAYSISQNAQGVISASFATIRTATDTQSGILSTGAQLIGGSKGFTDGIALGGDINTTPYIRFRNHKSTSVTDENLGYIQMVDQASPTEAHLTYYQYSYNAAGTSRLNYVETYSLPTANTGRTNNASYKILTTKEPIQIEQGGTGATTTDAAQDALGLTPVAAPCTYTTNTLVTETNFYNGWSCYMMGKLVIAAVNITPAAASSNAYVNIGVVPTLARPLQQVQTRIPVTGSTIVGLRVATNGNISLYKTSNATTAFYTTFCWFVP